MTAAAFGFGTPFFEQIEFYKRKLNLPTERWDDIKKAAHDRAFIVAGAQKADLLADLNGAVGKAIEQGTGYAEFHRDFKAIVAKHGWTGWTGEGSKAGEAWRSKVIYQTNLTTSYAAGRYRQLTDPDFLTLRPYWRYVHADWVANPRQQHVAWNGLTLPHDHAFWKTHYPPNGWGCHCTIHAVDASEYAKSQAAGQAEPPADWDTRDAKGNLPGVAKGFDYAPGRTWFPDLDKYPANTAREIVAANLQDGVFDRWQARVASEVASESAKPEYAGMSTADLSRSLRNRLARGENYPVAVLDQRAKQALGTETQVVLLSDDTTIKQAIHRDGQDLPIDAWARLQQAIDAAEWVSDRSPNSLVYFHDAGDLMVAAIKVAANKQDAWLVSLRRGNDRELKAGIASGRIRKW
jgi:hypothetical protein